MIEYNNLYFIKDGSPWFPVMGEYQYSRSDSRYWVQGIAKMKATGIDVVSCYNFWLHHEELKGHFNFRGNNNLRKFALTIKDAGLMMCLRIGPWVHAEARGGGFPDWVYAEDFKPRTNDPKYLKAVERYFTALFEQCKGLMYKDGGPIFAIQVENEYSQWGVQGDGIGDEHINTLIVMLKKIGFDVPIYMATGWGQAAVGNAISVWGGYCEAPWEYTSGELAPMDGYLFSNNPNDVNIGSDSGKKEMDTDISKAKHPYAMVELGSGIQVTKHRRPIICGDDCAAMAFCKLGSGVSLLGYYVYHGGMNPIGAKSTMQEYRDEKRGLAGFYSDLPEINYDFQAAIGQYGKMNSGAKTLKLCNYFINDFGKQLCQMSVILPKDNASEVDDFASRRYAVRSSGSSGFVFINNYIRHYDMPEREFNNFVFDAGKEQVRFADFIIKNKQYCVFPFNMCLKGGAILKYITATPFCILNGNDYVFWSYDGSAKYEIDGDFDGKIIVLSKAEAENSFKINVDGRDLLETTDGEIFELDEKIMACFMGNKKSAVKIRHLVEEENFADYEVIIDKYDDKCTNAFLQLDYEGDSIDVFIDGEKIADNFYTGQPYEIGMKNHNFAKRLNVRVYAINKDDFVYLEKPPFFINGKAMRLNGGIVHSEYQRIIKSKRQ